MKLALLLISVSISVFASDWLVAPPKEKAVVIRSADGRQVTMTNGLIRRIWRLAPAAATVAFDNLSTRESLLRGVKPEAELTMNGQHYEVGGLAGQPEWAYLRAEWIDRMKPNADAFHFIRLETGVTQPRFGWKRAAYSGSQPWPPPGASLTFFFDHDKLPGVHIAVHYEMYDGLPVISKWSSSTSL